MTPKLASGDAELRACAENLAKLQPEQRKLVPGEAVIIAPDIALGLRAIRETMNQAEVRLGNASQALSPGETISDTDYTNHIRYSATLLKIVPNECVFALNRVETE